jgi:hypothetical protein
MSDTQTDEPIAPVKRRGRITVDTVIYGALGHPATNEAWHDALLLPERYDVERWERTRSQWLHDVFEIWVLSEDIPEVDASISQIEVNILMRSESNEDYTARTVSVTRIDFSYWDGEHWQTITGKEEVNPRSRVIVTPQPTGFVEMPGLLSSDGLEQVRHEAEIMMRDYDGGVPFPEYVAEYARTHPAIWQYRPIAQKEIAQ